MHYIEHTISLVVTEDESEVAVQAMTDALEKLQEVQGVTLYGTEWREQEVPEPENAAAMGRDASDDAVRAGF